MTSKYRYYLGWFIKLGIVILTAAFLYSKLNDNKSINDFQHTIRQFDHFTVAVILFGVAMLMAANWLSEAYKWKIMISYVEPISFWRAVQAVICGLSIGI